MMKKLILATENAGKVRELTQILAGFTVISQKDAGFDGDVEETGRTFEENALLKARTVHAATGGNVAADDSGLVVDALNGAPGIYSARFSGVHGDDGANNDKLLKLLKDVPETARTARFYCAAAVVLEDGRELVASGVIEGYVACEIKGTGGFGYDPLFIEKKSGVRFSEMSMKEKNLCSHRRRAFEALAVKLEEAGAL